MKIYLASRYSRREELTGYAEQLTSLGYKVITRWLQGDDQLDNAGLSKEAEAAERTRYATEDWDDLMNADMVISFTEFPRGTNSRGGRHVEFGAAMATGKRCIVVGYRENVFHCLPDVEFYPTWISCLKELERLPPLPFSWRTCPNCNNIHPDDQACEECWDTRARRQREIREQWEEEEQTP